MVIKITCSNRHEQVNRFSLDLWEQQWWLPEGHMRWQHFVKLLWTWQKPLFSTCWTHKLLQRQKFAHTGRSYSSCFQFKHWLVQPLWKQASWCLVLYWHHFIGLLKHTPLWAPSLRKHVCCWGYTRPQGAITGATQSLPYAFSRRALAFMGRGPIFMYSRLLLRC